MLLMEGGSRDQRLMYIIVCCQQAQEYRPSPWPCLGSTYQASTSKWHVAICVIVCVSVHSDAPSSRKLPLVSTFPRRPKKLWTKVSLLLLVRVPWTRKVSTSLSKSMLVIRSFFLPMVVALSRLPVRYVESILCTRDMEPLTCFFFNRNTSCSVIPRSLPRLSSKSQTIHLLDTDIKKRILVKLSPIVIIKRNLYIYVCIECRP